MKVQLGVILYSLYSGINSIYFKVLYDHKKGIRHIKTGIFNGYRCIERGMCQEQPRLQGSWSQHGGPTGTDRTQVGPMLAP